MQPNQSRTGDAPQQLRQDIGREFRKIPRHHRKTEGDRWVQVRVAAAAGDRREYTAQYGECPPRTDDDPSPTFTFRLLEQNVGYHSVAQEDENGCTHKLAKEW